MHEYSSRTCTVTYMYTPNAYLRAVGTLDYCLVRSLSYSILVHAWHDSAHSNNWQTGQRNLRIPGNFRGYKCLWFSLIKLVLRTFIPTNLIPHAYSESTFYILITSTYYRKIILSEEFVTGILGIGQFVDYLQSFVQRVLQGESSPNTSTHYNTI